MNSPRPVFTGRVIERVSHMSHVLSFCSLGAGLKIPPRQKKGSSDSRKASTVSGIELNCGVTSSRETILLSGGVFWFGGGLVCEFL